MRTSRPAHGAAADFDLTAKKFSQAHRARRPARVLHAVRRRQQEQREEHHEEQRDDHQKVIDLRSGGEGDPDYGDEPKRCGDRGLDGNRMHAGLGRFRTFGAARPRFARRNEIMLGLAIFRESPLAIIELSMMLSVSGCTI